MWPKTTLLPGWPRDAERLDIPVLLLLRCLFLPLSDWNLLTWDILNWNREAQKVPDLPGCRTQHEQGAGARGKGTPVGPGPV